ncbi:MAG TPA: 50S ribosomal protein L21 [Dictyobacter sp.]|jgi:large subunit ribosomal protein L21|nr:50S ribosomal protein L21 [Dictyobacter sp.]
MYAVIKNGGRQYKVTVGQNLEVNRLAVEDGAEVRISEVLLIADDNNQTQVGAPFIEGAEVVATVARKDRGPKLIVFKYKSKKRYRHRSGHRQDLTVLTINDILANGKSLVNGQTAQAEEAPATSAPAEETEPAATEKKTTRRRRTAKESTEE